MGTHPIFESDFDCLTEQIYNGLQSGQRGTRTAFPTVGELSTSATIQLASTQTNSPRHGGPTLRQVDASQCKPGQCTWQCEFGIGFDVCAARIAQGYQRQNDEHGQSAGHVANGDATDQQALRSGSTHPVGRDVSHYCYYVSNLEVFRVKTVASSTLPLVTRPIKRMFTLHFFVLSLSLSLTCNFQLIIQVK